MTAEANTDQSSLLAVYGNVPPSKLYCVASVYVCLQLLFLLHLQAFLFPKEGNKMDETLAGQVEKGSMADGKPHKNNIMGYYLMSMDYPLKRSASDIDGETR